MVGDYDLTALPTAHFGRAVIEAQPASAQELGCEPDYNAYTGNENPRPNGNVNFRTGAGHVHIGWTTGADPFDEGHFRDCRMLAQQLDAYLAMPAMMFDKDVTRRSLYGDFGAFRPKPYGMEYRVLSNAWLQSPELIDWVFNQTKLAFEQLLLRGVVVCNNARQLKEHVENRVYSADFLCDHFNIPKPPKVQLSNGVLNV